MHSQIIHKLTFHSIVILLGLILGFSPLKVNAQSQGVLLRGFVRDAENAHPLTGANILLKELETGKTTGAVSGANGYYVVHELPQSVYALRISFIGYQPLTDTLNLDKKTEYTFTAELKPAKQQMDEIVVTGETGGASTLEAGLQTITPENLSLTTPSINGDLANYLQTLPGVVSMGDRGGQLFIRGGSPDQNLVLMDRMQIYRPFHIVGFYSAFPQDLISGAQVYAGGFPAKYSGRLSSVIDVSMRGGNQNSFEGAATLGPFLTGLRVEGPINDDGFTFLASGRFSQIERTSSFLFENEQPLRFGDQFIKLQNTSDDSWCSFTGLHTYDRGKIDTDRDDVFRWSNYGFGGRCVTIATESSTLFDISANASVADNSVGTGDNPQRTSSIWNVTTQIDISTPLKGGHEISGGFKGNVISTKYSLDESFEQIRSDDDFLTRFTGYAGMKIKLNRNLEINPSFVVSGAMSYGVNFAPRFRSTWRPFGDEDQELNAAFGLYHQTMVGVSDERDLGSTFSAWILSPLEKDNPRAWHAILGWNQQIGNFGLAFEGYHKRMENLVVPAWSNFARFTTEMTNADGTVWGFDIRGEFRKGNVYGYLGYGFNWTQYKTFQEHLSREFQTYHPAHDQRHSINALFGTDLGFANLDIRWQFGSGMPYTQPFGFDSIFRIRDLQDPRDDYGEPRLLFDKPYEGRLPNYHRLDVSIDRVFEFDVVNLTAKGGVINAYNRRNLFYYDLFRLRRVDQLPIIPFVAVEIATN